MSPATARDRFITVFGRMPVLEALRDRRVAVDKVLVARTATGDSLAEILAEAAGRGLRIQYVSPERVTRISRNGRHDQGVVADIVAPGAVDLEAWLEARAADGPAELLLLDAVTNPANVGMVVRTAAAAGLDGVVLPRRGCPDVGPVLIKASAGVALFAPILRTETALDATEALANAGFDIIGLRATGAPALWDVAFRPATCLVLGNETSGITPAVAQRIGHWISIPVSASVESLNVACAAAVVSYELVRRRTAAS